MVNLLDSYVLNYPNRVTHPFDIHPTFWDKIARILKRKDVVSLDKVKSEIYRNKDELMRWCNSNIPSDFWNSSNESIIEYTEIQNWAQSQAYYQSAKAEFAKHTNADAFIASYALHSKRHGEDISDVTQEVSRPNSKSNKKLPDVCVQFSIKCIRINKFFRIINASF